MATHAGGEAVSVEQPPSKRINNILPPLSSLFLPTSPQHLMLPSGVHFPPMLPQANLARPRLSLPDLGTRSANAPTISFAGGPLVSSLSAQTDLGNAPVIPAAARFKRQLPMSPSREDSHSSEDSQASYTFDKVGNESNTLDQPAPKKHRVVTDRWLPEEDEQLARAVRKWQSESGKTGLCPWRTIAQKVGGHHTSAQCAQRWRRVLRPELKKGPWTVDQEEKLIRLVLELGPMWSKVSTEMGDRSDIQCRYWFRKLRQMGADNWSVGDDMALRQLHAQLHDDWRAIARGIENSNKKRAHSASACLARVLLVHPSMH